MSTVKSRIDTNSEEFRSNRDAMLELVGRLDGLQAEARAGGGEKYVQRHHDRNRLLPRERIALLLDEDSPFLELSSIAGAGVETHPGSSRITGLGLIAGTLCAILATDPTIRGGATNPTGLRRTLRCMDIARENRLPLVILNESAGADLPRQGEMFVEGGQSFRNLTQLSAAGIPTITLVFGPSTAGGAYLPGMSDYAVFVKGQARVYLGGPPLVKMATGEIADPEELGGAVMHARVSGVADYLAEDERDALRIGRGIVANLGMATRRTPDAVPEPPAYPEDELLGLAPADVRAPIDPREIIARIVDGSRFEEFKDQYGAGLVCGWATIDAHRVGVLANHRGVIFNEEAQKASQFIQLCDRIGTPLVFLQNVTGFMVGTEYEQRGIIKDGAKLINAVANCAVPKITVVIGASYGAGNYAMAGRAYQPRFCFSWPNSRIAVMGPSQLSGVMRTVMEDSARRAGTDIHGAEFVARADARQAEVADLVEGQSTAFYATARLWDDGMIDPRDTRNVLTVALEAIQHRGAGRASDYGVFRM